MEVDGCRCQVAKFGVCVVMARKKREYEVFVCTAATESLVICDQYTAIEAVKCQRVMKRFEGDG